MKEELLKKVYEMSGGANLADLILEYELNSKFPLELTYKNVCVNDNNEIIVEVFDKITECPFKLKFNEQTTQLEMYYE
jgi:hypothetical protein